MKKKKEKVSLDATDRKILHYLQRDASLTIKEIAKKSSSFAYAVLETHSKDGK